MVFAISYYLFAGGKQAFQKSKWVEPMSDDDQYHNNYLDGVRTPGSILHYSMDSHSEFKRSSGGDALFKSSNVSAINNRSQQLIPVIESSKFDA